MIFVIVGTQKFQFNRLLKALDVLVEQGDMEEEIFAQIGYSDYIPEHYSYERFLDKDKFNNAIDNASIVITHGGTGAIINSVKRSKKVIAVPRRKKYGEHVDDHQLQIVEQFYSANLIEKCNDCNELAMLIVQIREKLFDSYKSNTETIIKSIDNYLINYLL